MMFVNNVLKYCPSHLYIATQNACRQEIVCVALSHFRHSLVLKLIVIEKVMDDPVKEV